MNPLPFVYLGHVPGHPTIHPKFRELLRPATGANHRFLHPHSLRKGDRLVREGQTCRDFYFINTGAFRQFQLLDDGTEATLNLFVENDWVIEYKSMITQTPATTSQHPALLPQACTDFIYLEQG